MKHSLYTMGSLSKLVCRIDFPWEWPSQKLIKCYIIIMQQVEFLLAELS